MNPKTFLPSPSQLLRGAGLVLCLALPVVPMAASAQDNGFTLHVEPAAALWVDEPQMTRFTPGFYGAIRPGISLGRVVAIELSYAYLVTPAVDADIDDGGAHLAGGGLRVRPFATLQDREDQLGGLFVDGHANYVRTGELDRFGADVGLGYTFQAGSAFAFGPVVRYTHIVQPDDLPGVNSEDGQLLTAGLDFSFGTPYRAPPAAAVAPVTECPKAQPCPKEAPTVAKACPDRDGDTVCDAVDRCPTQAGAVDMYGCNINPCGDKPIYVLVQFPYDSSALPSPDAKVAQSMDPVLDAVAAAIAKDSTCRVCVIGHASEEGTSEYNQTLSVERAGAVRTYLTQRGLTATRLPYSGVGERCQLEPTTSRELNRRVEFRRIDKGDVCPTTCAD